ncbi:hypothetical protein MRX96_023867 [Rhipicephalus microplus]
MITAALCHVLLLFVQTICTVAPTEHAPYSTTTQIRLPFRLSWLRRRNAYRLVDAPAIMGIRIERDTVKRYAPWRQWSTHHILPLSKSDCRSACLGFAGGTHIDILLVDAPAIMGFRIGRDTVKFAHYKGAATITTALWAQ